MKFFLTFLIMGKSLLGFFTLRMILVTNKMWLGDQDMILRNYYYPLFLIIGKTRQKKKKRKNDEMYKKMTFQYT